MKIGSFDLDTLGRPFLVAEAGSTHQGDPAVALQMARVAVEAGADALTFQEIDEQRLYTDLPELPVPRQDRVGWDCLRECRTIAKDAGLAFSVCVTDLPALEGALALGIDFIKIVSYDVTFEPFLERCGETGLPVLMSTGASRFDEVARAVEILDAKDRLVLYHTDCGYPTPDEDVNLRRMVALRDKFGVPVGYCDHTDHGLSCLAATALGAAVIEKHFTIDRTRGGADHMVALEPTELARLFGDIRRVAAIRGHGGDEIAQREMYRRTHLRRSLALSRDVAAGETITEDALTMLRPSGGMAWQDRQQVIGRRAVRDLLRRHQLTPDDVTA